jgi:hypothetical protein
MNQFVCLSAEERLDYFVATSETINLSPQMVEKDLWVCWVLEKLFSLDEIGSTLIFKGGTSLSKAYMQAPISTPRQTLGATNEDGASSAFGKPAG